MVETVPDTNTDEWWMYPENITYTADFLADAMLATGQTVRDFYEKPWKFTAVYHDAMIARRIAELQAELPGQG